MPTSDLADAGSGLFVQSGSVTPHQLLPGLLVHFGPGQDMVRRVGNLHSEWG